LEAIFEAVGRPNMRFSSVKSAAQQAALLHHRARDLLVRQRTMLSMRSGSPYALGGAVPSNAIENPVSVGRENFLRI
jgi:transposase